MIHQTVTYTNFLDEKVTEECYFNLSKTDAAEILDIAPRLQAFAEATSGAEQRDLTSTETKELLDILKTLTLKAYGKRSADGRKFSKSPEIVADFIDTGCFDAFLFGLMVDMEKANDFMVGILPKDLDSLLEEQKANNARIQGQQDATVVQLPPQEGDLVATEMDVPAWLREDRDPTQAEFAKMDRAEMQLAFQKKQERAERKAGE